MSKIPEKFKNLRRKFFKLKSQDIEDKKIISKFTQKEFLKMDLTLYLLNVEDKYSFAHIRKLVLWAARSDNYNAQELIDLCVLRNEINDTKYTFFQRLHKDMRKLKLEYNSEIEEENKEYRFIFKQEESYWYLMDYIFKMIQKDSKKKLDFSQFSYNWKRIVDFVDFAFLLVCPRDWKDHDRFPECDYYAWKKSGFMPYFPSVVAKVWWEYVIWFLEKSRKIQNTWLTVKSLMPGGEYLNLFLDLIEQNWVHCTDEQINHFWKTGQVLDFWRVDIPYTLTPREVGYEIMPFSAIHTCEEIVEDAIKHGEMMVDWKRYNCDAYLLINWKKRNKRLEKEYEIRKKMKRRNLAKLKWEWRKEDREES